MLYTNTNEVGHSRLGSTVAGTLISLPESYASASRLGVVVDDGSEGGNKLVGSLVSWHSDHNPLTIYDVPQDAEVLCLPHSLVLQIDFGGAWCDPPNAGHSGGFVSIDRLSTQIHFFALQQPRRLAGAFPVDASIWSVSRRSNPTSSFTRAWTISAKYGDDLIQITSGL